MLNDTTNTTNTTNNTNQPDETPLPMQDYALMAALIATFTRHIETLVDQRFAALVESHKTLALMDENMQLAIANLIDERIGEHESDKAHPSDSDIESEVNEGIERYVRFGSHDFFITESRLSEKVSDVLDEILDDRIRNALDNATISISV